jgi:hypothetical protein
MSRHQPNQRLLTAADKLARYTAVQVTAAVEMLRDRIAHAHEDNSQGERVTTSDMPDPTARAAGVRYAASTQLEALRDAITETCSTLDKLADMATEAQRWCQPNAQAEELKLCKHGQHGRDGVVEWGDPLCDRLPDKLGMCSREYMRYYRWCNEHGVDRSRDFEAA